MIQRKQCEKMQSQTRMVWLFFGQIIHEIGMILYPSEKWDMLS